MAEVSEPLPLLGTIKDADRDRILADRRRQNACEAHLGGADSHAACASDMAEFEVPQGFASSDDLVDMFGCIDVPEARARTNGIAVYAHGRDFPSLPARARGGVKPDDRCVPCLGHLPMGDLNALT